ncbi:hypothetical protein [Spiroplasma eriocheiris]|uniref:Transmembrane protein n=1 Tax=Spiroplasma eriocheiris TaxID=315358 RepID=A0A0H3XMU3_9MOLU|nr:hypothetical protein [Spiroplasma eriocheiris]AHF57930.1 hypothetical protein SPE_0808 [Spiroplasma eriocheiris CCTCC M 207170]AKM54372.1 hypothetical protein SERIO_v1c08100 [Spiroplasma eriocheiris]
MFKIKPGFWLIIILSLISALFIFLSTQTVSIVYNGFLTLHNLSSDSGEDDNQEVILEINDPQFHNPALLTTVKMIKYQKNNLWYQITNHFHSSNNYVVLETLSPVELATWYQPAQVFLGNFSMLEYFFTMVF